MKNRYEVREWNLPFLGALAINFAVWGIFAVVAYYWL